MGETSHPHLSDLVARQAIDLALSEVTQLAIGRLDWSLCKHNVPVMHVLFYSVVEKRRTK